MLEALESDIRSAIAARDHARAATAILEGLGPEILGYLAAVLRREDAAAEVFSEFAEDLWKGLPSFRLESSARTWSYTVARHAMHRYLRGPDKRARRGVPLSRAPEIAALEAAVRERTLPYLRTDVKDRVSRIREEMSAEDQELLILRVDRQMSWDEIARVTSEDEAAEPAQLKKRAAALRKRFERIKTRLREIAEREGLLDGD